MYTYIYTAVSHSHGRKEISHGELLGLLYVHMYTSIFIYVCGPSPCRNVPVRSKLGHVHKAAHWSMV